MPRIDPSQLLKTLSVLLAKDGGIRSAEEVPRIVQLMQKFSKKLVSKCIYIHILRSSTPELLENFLVQKGWDLLNMWFLDAMKNQNFYLCGDLVRLFAVCPMNPARLKENVDVNQAPKLIRQLSCDPRTEQDTRTRALQVLQQWMTVIRTPPNVQAVNVKTNSSQQVSESPAAVPPSPSSAQKTTESSSVSNGLSSVSTAPPAVSTAPPAVAKVSLSKKNSPSKKVTSRSNVIVDTSESEDCDDPLEPQKKTVVATEPHKNSSKRNDVKNGGLKANLSESVVNDHNNLSREDSTDVDDLLGGDTTSDDDTAKKSVAKPAVLPVDNPEKKKEEKERREKEREERKKREREKEKKRAQERRDKAKPYSRTELRGSLDSNQKDRIKEVAKKMKEESSKAKENGSGMGRIPKLPKKESSSELPAKKPGGGASFADMLGEIDTMKPKVKAPPIKNKNRDLLESINNPSPHKLKQKSDVRHSSSSSSKSGVEDRSRKPERRNSMSETDKVSSFSKSRTPEKGEKSERSDKSVKTEKSEKLDKTEKHDKLDKPEKSERSDKVEKTEKSDRAEKTEPFDKVEKSEKDDKSEKASVDSRPKPTLNMPEKVAEKRSLKEASPKIEKKSPSVIKESNFFGDMLGDIMKDQPRKKKRRLSDVKAEKEAKEAADRMDKAQKEAEKQLKDLEKLSGSSEEDKMDVSESEELPFGEPASDLPREVRGILVYGRGNKPKRKIQWRPDDRLVEIEYFEMDETERANVWKLKSFEEMRKKEMSFEKSHKTGQGMPLEEADPEDIPSRGGEDWKLTPLSFEGEIQETLEKIWRDTGKDSQEKGVQDTRELGVLKALFFNQVPSDPSEPDVVETNPDSAGKHVEIPPVDMSENRDDSSNDYSREEWPGPSLGTTTQPSPNLSSLNALLKDLKPGLLNLLGSGATTQLPNLEQPPPNHGLNSADAQLFQAQKAAAESMQFNVQNPTPSGGPPPNGIYPGGQNYQERVQPPQTLFSERGNQQRNFSNNRQPGYKGGNNYSHSGGHYNKKDSGGRDYRGDRNYRGSSDFKRPCKFWMEKGKCKEEDRCMYPHPSR